MALAHSTAIHYHQLDNRYCILLAIAPIWVYNGIRGYSPIAMPNRTP